MLLKHLPFIVIIMLFASISVVSSVSAQDEDEWGADVNSRIVGDIQSVKVSDWTEIELELKDGFGIDWGRLSQQLPIWWMKLFWPLNPAFPQPVQRFLGPTSFKLEPEIIQGDPNGWYTKVSPSSINGSVTGDTHSFTLLVQADDAYLDNSVVVGIKVTRIDTLGGVIGSSYVYVPVKASPTNFVKMRTLEASTKQAPLKSMVYFTLDIVNEGFYRDVFQFELEEENGLLGLMDQQAVTIHPGETKRVTLGILTPEKLYDMGTPNEVRIYVRSTGDDTKTLVGNLVVITKGIYISPLVGIIATPIIALLAIGFISFIFYKDKQDRELYGKPGKPWNLPAERKHLQELKEKDAEQYQEVLNMMKQEYQSALLYWKNSQHQKGTGFLSKDEDSSAKKELKEKDETIEKKEFETEEKQMKKPFLKKISKRKKPKEITKEKEAEIEESEENIKEKKSFDNHSKDSKESFNDIKQTSSAAKKEGSPSKKLVKGLKKWFTVPEEEKQKKQLEPESVEPEEKHEESVQKSNQREDIVREISEDGTKETENEYNQELKRLEEEQKRKQAQKAEQQKKLEKQKAINRVKKAQEKKRKK